MSTQIASGDLALIGGVREPYIARILWCDRFDVLAEHQIMECRIRQLTSIGNVLAVGSLSYLEALRDAIAEVAEAAS